MTKSYGAYRPIVRAGEFYFVSGQIGVDQETNACPETIEEQVEQVFVNLQQVLSTEGLNLSDVVKTTVYLTNMDNFQAFNEVYARHFPEPRPSRSTVAVKELPRVVENRQLLIEIEAIAHKRRDNT